MNVANTTMNTMSAKANAGISSHRVSAKLPAVIGTSVTADIKNIHFIRVNGEYLFIISLNTT